MTLSSIAEEARALNEVFGQDDIYAQGCLKCAFEAWLASVNDYRALLGPEEYTSLVEQVSETYSAFEDEEDLAVVSRVGRPLLLYVLSSNYQELQDLSQYGDLVLPRIEQLVPNQLGEEWTLERRLEVAKIYLHTLRTIILTAYLAFQFSPRRRDRFGRRFHSLLRRYYRAHGRTLSTLALPFRQL